MRLLLVEDHAELAEWVGRSLRQAGFVLDVLGRGDHADQALRTERYDLVILDLSLPGLDGLEVLRRLRQRESGADGGPPTPVLALTARGSTGERVQGLNLGADDYLPKPFEPKELVLRIKNILRRAPQENEKQETRLNLGLCRYDLETRELTGEDGEIVHITPVEQSMLSLLGQKPGQIFSRDRLAELLGAGQGPRSIDVQVTRLRKKIERDSKNPRYLQTVRGKGYMLLTE